MAWRICWHCEVKSHQTMHGDPYPQLVVEDFAIWMAAFSCDECRVLSLARVTAPRHMNADMVAEFMVGPDVRPEWLPVTSLGRRYPDVPDHIAEAASEAHACHSIRSYRAAVLMARSVIEATAKHKGITKGVLRDKIDEMRNQDLVRELVRRQAHAIRLLGNEMAHGDFVDPISEEESAEILGLMGEVLAEVYQAPARLKALQDARQARSAAPAGP